MFSSRTPGGIAPNALTWLLAEVGGARIDLTASNPTTGSLPRLADDLLARLGRPAAAVYAPDPRGLPAAREAVTNYYASHGVEAPADRVVLTASTSEAYSWLLKLLCDPGEAVLVPAPSYPLLDALAGLEAATLRRYELPAEDGWAVHAAPILERVEELEDEGLRVGAVVLVNPNNPTGTSIGAAQLDLLLDGAARHGFAVISDEVFLDYRFEDRAGDVRVVAARNEALVFSLGGLSKSAAAPQLKLGWILMNGPAGRLREASARLDWIADAFLSVGTPVQLALPDLLARREETAGPLRARLLENLSALRERFPSGGAAEPLPFRAGWSAVLRVPATEGEESLTLRLLRDAGVLVHPGHFYEFPHEAFLVLSLLPEPETFREGLSRLRATLGT